MQPFDPNKPFDHLPDLPPPVDLETRAILKACIDARTTLAELKANGRLIPNQAVLINTLPILEARDSSEIENIVTTTDRLFQLAASTRSDSDPATKEALRYRTALQVGFEKLKRRPVCVRVAEEICSTILDRPVDVRRVPGTALVNQSTGEVIYTPPAGEALLRDKLSNWERFLHARDELDPLVRMAIGHYQFEAIHPFTDGNGRTGRILNLLLLVEQDLLDLPILYLSRHIIANKADYYAKLIAVTREQAWEPWILFMLEAVATTARWTTDKIVAIDQLMADTVDRVRTRLPKIYSRELVEVIFTQPYCRIANLVELDIAKRETASNYLKRLRAEGLLEERKVGREKLFINTALVDLLAD